MEREGLPQNIEVKERSKRQAWVTWAGPGHEREYTVNFEEYGHSSNGSDESYIPQEFVQKLKDMIGEGFNIDNRGSRLEIYPPQDMKPYDAHFNVAGAMQGCFGEEYAIEFVNMFKSEAKTDSSSE